MAGFVSGSGVKSDPRAAVKIVEMVSEEKRQEVERFS